MEAFFLLNLLLKAEHNSLMYNMQIIRIHMTTQQQWCTKAMLFCKLPTCDFWLYREPLTFCIALVKAIRINKKLERERERELI
jgi:hypothetical protein